MTRAAVVFSLQNWLGESEDTKKSNSTPGYFNVAMSCMAPLNPQARFRHQTNVNLSIQSCPWLLHTSPSSSPAPPPPRRHQHDSNDETRQAPRDWSDGRQNRPRLSTTNIAHGRARGVAMAGSWRGELYDIPKIYA